MKVIGHLIVVQEATNVDIDDVFAVKDILKWVSAYYSPCEVYSDDELYEWAYEEGLVSESTKSVSAKEAT